MSDRPPPTDREREKDLEAALGELPQSDSRVLRDIGNRLASQRPAPSAAYRSRLKRALGNANPMNRPPQLRLLVTVYACSGSILLVGAALGLAGIGPLNT